MAKKNLELKTDQNGRYVRNIGKVRQVDPPYHVIRPKFYLGRDQNQAKVANARLEQLWELVVEQWREGSANEDVLFDQPMWDVATFEIAKAVAKGAMQIKLPKNPFLLDDDELNSRWVRKMIHRYGAVITILPAFEREFQEVRHRERQELAQVKKRVEDNPIRSTETLHVALDAFVEHIKSTCSQHIQGNGKVEMSNWGNTQIKNIGRLKEHHADRQLSSLTLDVMEEMELHWAKRPNRKGTDTPIAAKTADSHLKQLRAFFKWLHRNPKFDWRRPEDYGEVKHQPKLQPREIAQLLTPAQVETFSLDELCILYEYANPLETCLLMLGLNCGFGSAEVSSLRLNEIHLYKEHLHPELINYQTSKEDSFIQRIRQKTRVYSEFKLWKQTAQSMEWLIQRRKAQKTPATKDALAFLTDKGHPYVKQTEAGNTSNRIANLWEQGLIKRIRKDHPDFSKLSFGKLRKTAGDLVRKFSDGEISGVFLCHGNPVKSDKLQDVYTNRPFGKVFAALDKVEEYLQPVFERRINPCEVLKRSTFSKQQNNSILEMHRQGMTAAEIAEKAGVSTMTVYRRIK